MTTGLLAGLSLGAAAVAVSEKAASMLRPGDKLAVWTEVGQSAVLIGIATAAGSAAVSVDRSEYDGLRVMEALFGGVLH